MLLSFAQNQRPVESRTAEGGAWVKHRAVPGAFLGLLYVRMETRNPVSKTFMGQIAHFA